MDLPDIYRIWNRISWSSSETPLKQAPPEKSTEESTPSTTTAEQTDTDSQPSKPQLEPKDHEIAHLRSVIDQQKVGSKNDSVNTRPKADVNKIKGEALNSAQKPAFKSHINHTSVLDSDHTNNSRLWPQDPSFFDFLRTSHWCGL